MNVIANPSFGFQVSESGSGYTWSGNSRENQLTPWSNDPVSDPASEAIYVRDDETGEVWGPTALPIRREESTYVARHGPGYSRFEHVRDGIELDLVQFVALDDPVKVSVLTIENRSGRARRLSVTAYAEWVLGTSRGASAPRIVTALDPETQALLARNPWNTEFGGRVAFLDLGGRQTAWTADRTEFLGRNGGPTARPASTAATGCGAPSAPASTRAPRSRPASSSPTGRGPRSWCCSARRRTAAAATELIRRGRAARSRGHAARHRRATGTTPRARSRCARPTARWTSCSTAGCSTRRWPAGSGRGRRSTRPAARTGSATSSRTSSRW